MVSPMAKCCLQQRGAALLSGVDKREWRAAYAPRDAVTSLALVTRTSRAAQVSAPCVI